MLYLLRTYGPANSTLLKVGYASNLENRKEQYISHNPLISFLGSREGTILDETKIHLYLRDLGHRELRDEWYKDDPEVIRIFKETSMSDIDEYVWENRDRLFGRDMFFRNIYEKQIYLDLLSAGNTLDPEKSSLDKKYLGWTKEQAALPEIERIKATLEEDRNELENMILDFYSDKNFERRMKLLCDFIDRRPETYKQYSGYMSSFIPIEYQNYIELLGPGKIRSRSYVEADLKREVSNLLSSSNLLDDLLKRFSVGSRYTLKDIKESLRELYLDKI